MHPTKRVIFKPGTRRGSVSLARVTEKLKYADDWSLTNFHRNSGHHETFMIRKFPEPHLNLATCPGTTGYKETPCAVMPFIRFRVNFTSHKTSQPCSPSNAC
jgi:hypothetical protein